MKEAHIGAKEEAVDWEVDNKYLNTGYRINYHSISLVMKSIFQKHNELMNIWTHLIGSMIFLGLLVYACVGFTPMVFRTDTSLLKTGVDDLLVKGSEWTADYVKQINHEFVGVGVGIGHPGGGNPHGVQAIVTQVENLDARLPPTSPNWTDARDLQNSILDFRIVLLYFKKNIDQNANAYYKQRFSTRFDMLIQNLTKLEQPTGIQTNIKRMLTSAKSKIQILISNLKNSLLSLVKETKVLNLRFVNSEKTLEVYPIWIFIVTAICCMGFSTTYHLCFPISKKVYTTLHKLDHAGISILIFGSSFAMYYYFFYCNTLLKSLYSIFILVNCLVVFGFSMGDAVHKPKNSKWKAAMYASLGLSNVVPMVHFGIRAFLSHRNTEYLPFNRCFLLIVAVGAIYLLGLTIYTTKVPERFFPAKCDIWCNSHAIWHCFVFAATFVHYINVLLIYQTRTNHVCT